MKIEIFPHLSTFLNDLNETGETSPFFKRRCAALILLRENNVHGFAGDSPGNSPYVKGASSFR